MQAGKWDLHTTQYHDFTCLFTCPAIYPIDGFTWRAQVRDKETDVKVLDLTCTANATNRTIILSATAEQTALLEPKTYRWSLEQTDASLLVQELIIGDLIVGKYVTKGE